MNNGPLTRQAFSDSSEDEDDDGDDMASVANRLCAYPLLWIAPGR